MLVEVVRVRKGSACENVRLKPRSFVEQVLSGDAKADDISDFVERWHTGDTTIELAEYLGFSPTEYARWVEEPGSLETLLEERRKRLARRRTLAAVPA